MTEAIVAIRPEPGLSATIAAGQAAGLAIAGYPLFEIEPLPWQAPPHDSVDGLLIGSANAIRHGGDALAQLRDKPVHAVGQATADAAREAGFTVATVGKGMLQGVVDRLGEGPASYLRLAGEERVAVTSPPQVSITIRTLYRIVPQPFPKALEQTLREGALVMLYSAAASRHFAAECDRLAIDRSGIRVASLAPRIAEPLGEGWRGVRSAECPSQSSLLALVADMCHEPRV